jgi:hypothetical protein
MQKKCIKIIDVENPQDEESKDEVNPFKKMQMAVTEFENL